VVVHFAADAGLSIVPWGGGTGLMGGARPTTDSIVLDMRRMRRVLSIDRASNRATAQAGIVLEALDRRLRKARLTLGHDPWSRLPGSDVRRRARSGGDGFRGIVPGAVTPVAIR